MIPTPLSNQLQEHLSFMMMWWKEQRNTPWIRLPEIDVLARTDLAGHGYTRAYFSGLERLWRQQPLNRLLLHPDIAKDTIHRMAAEQMLAVRQRINHGNLEDVTTKRFAAGSPEWQSCTEAFRVALAQAASKSPLDLIADENIHVYYPTDLHFSSRDGGGGRRTEDDCACDEITIEVPSGVIPAPVPGGNRPTPAPGGAVPGGHIPVPA